MHDTTEWPRDAARRGRRTEGRILGPALVVSALVHGVFAMVFSFHVPTTPRTSSAPVIPLVHVTPAMQAFELSVVAGDAAPVEVEIRERAAVQPLPVRNAPAGIVPAPVTGDDLAAAEEVDPLSVRDRLRYRLNAPQVWRPPTEEIAVEPTPEEMVHRRIASQLSEYNDSVAAEAAARDRANDWTVKDADGGRWGVSPGAIHLGSVTIPIGNTQFAVAPGRREEFAGRVRTWGEIQAQAVRVEANETFKERVKAIEERKAKEREKRTGGATTTPPAPDGKPPGGDLPLL